MYKRQVQEHITKHYASTLKDDPDESRELIKSYIQKYLEANRKMCIRDSSGTAYSITDAANVP